jgi:hypothetical protein
MNHLPVNKGHQKLKRISESGTQNHKAPEERQKFPLGASYRHLQEKPFHPALQRVRG